MDNIQILLSKKEVGPLPENLPEASNDFDDDVHRIFSFIVRVWREESGTEIRRDIWRGHITVIPGGQKHYFATIDEIPALIEAHLNDNG